MIKIDNDTGALSAYELIERERQAAVCLRDSTLKMIEDARRDIASHEAAVARLGIRISEHDLALRALRTPEHRRSELELAIRNLGGAEAIAAAASELTPEAKLSPGERARYRGYLERAYEPASGAAP